MLLTVLAVVNSPYPYVCILVVSLLMVVFSIASFSEEPSFFLSGIQMILSVIFGILSWDFFPFLIVSKCYGIKKKWIRFLLPAAVYGMAVLVMQTTSLPMRIRNMLILLAGSVVLYFLEEWMIKYNLAQDKIAQAVSVTAVNEMYERKFNQELLMKNYLADKNARLEERENISRNIHNSVGHSITAAIMTLDAADMLFDTNPAEARKRMNTANARIRLSLDSIRQAVRVLDRENEYIEMRDFLKELTAVTDCFAMDTRIRICTDFSNVPESQLIPREHTEFLTGALQEFLTNGVKHGNADLFTVNLTTDSGHVRLCVIDNGKSDFGDENEKERIRNGFGLKKLISYTQKCGGKAQFLNENGFRAELTLPLYKEENNG